MCGIAGVLNLAGAEPIERSMLERMAAAIVHRGPDEDGFFVDPAGVGFASRRLSIVGLADGRQPITNETGDVIVVFNGEFFDYPEQRAALESRGHRFRTSADTEILVHLWEEHGEGMLPQLRGQFAFALFDRRTRTVILARDRVGICPLHHTTIGGKLYFGSEIKALLASGEVRAELDPKGLDHILTFFAMPSRRTMFRGVEAVYPGHYLKIRWPEGAHTAEVSDRKYWDLDFPPAGEEYDPPRSETLLEEFDAVFRRAVEIRLRADVPVVSYLSGGLDSTTALSVASSIRGQPIPTFTVRIPDPKLDETSRAQLAGRLVGSEPTVVTTGADVIAAAYPGLIQAAESPVVDTACASLYCLAAEVHRQGFKVALTGEGADEALAGYPWFKLNRLVGALDNRFFKPSNVLRRAMLWMNAPEASGKQITRLQSLVGGTHACLDLYGMYMLARRRFYTPERFAALDGWLAYEDLELDLPRLKTWHPLNQSLYLGYKTILPGLLIHQKGDRPAMRHSVETRYPFLDEDVIAFTSKIHPRWKLRGLRRDKHLLRLYAAKFLPPEITNRPKAMFRAPFANTFFTQPPAYVDALLSPESLAKTGYFNAAAVAHWRANYDRIGWNPAKRLSIEMGLTAVMATQLWHHTFLGGGLCELPTWTAQL